MSTIALAAALAFILVRDAPARAAAPRLVPALLIGALPGALLFLAHQHAATGAFGASSQRLYYALGDGPPGCFRYGFGAGVGCVGEHGDFVRARLAGGYGLLAAAGTTLRRLKAHLVDPANLEPLALLVPAGAFVARGDARGRALGIATVGADPRVRAVLLRRQLPGRRRPLLLRPAPRRARPRRARRRGLRGADAAPPRAGPPAPSRSRSSASPSAPGSTTRRCGTATEGAPSSSRPSSRAPASRAASSSSTPTTASTSRTTRPPARAGSTSRASTATPSIEWPGTRAAARPPTATVTPSRTAAAPRRSRSSPSRSRPSSPGARSSSRASRSGRRLAQRGGYALPEWAAGTCASAGRFLALHHGAAPAEVTLSLPARWLAGRSVTPRVAASGGARGALEIAGRRVDFAAPPASSAAAPVTCLDLPPIAVPAGAERVTLILRAEAWKLGQRGSAGRAEPRRARKRLTAFEATCDFHESFRRPRQGGLRERRR